MSSSFVFESGQAIKTGTHGETSYVYNSGDPVTNSGESNFVFESGTGIGGGTIEDIVPSATYHFWAGESDAADGSTSAGFPEIQAGLNDATPVNGPIYHTNLDGWPAFEYNHSEYHTWNDDGSITSEPWSVLFLARPDVLEGDRRTLLSWGDGEGTVEFMWKERGQGENEIHFNLFNKPDPGWSAATLTTDAWNTFGFAVDGSTVEYYVNGSPTTGGGTYGNADSPNAGGQAIANTIDGFESPIDGAISEIVISNQNEPDSTFSDYHTDRLG